MSIINFIFLTLLASTSSANDEQNLANVIQESHDAINRSLQRSSQCFSVYSPEMSALTLEFELEYEKCAQTAETATQCVNREVEQDLEIVDQLHKTICSGLSNCPGNMSNPYETFACNNAAASDAIRISYRLQTISRDKMHYLHMKYEVIKYDKYTCTQKCSRTYVEEIVKLHSKLQDCLKGNGSVETAITTLTEYN